MAHIGRGFLIGLSLGIFASLFGIVEPMPKAVLYGMIFGCLAGLTVFLKEKLSK